jgi:predicted DNA-binding transcriptional regulator YafY
MGGARVMADRGRTARRLLEILTILSDGTVHYRDDLVDRFGVCKRTIMRDIAILNELGFYVECERDDVRDSGTARASYQLLNPSPANRVIAKRRVVA